MIFSLYRIERPFIWKRNQPNKQKFNSFYPNMFCINIDWSTGSKEKRSQCIFIMLLWSPLTKECGFLNNLHKTLTKGCFVANLVEISPVVLEKIEIWKVLRWRTHSWTYLRFTNKWMDRQTYIQMRENRPLIKLTWSFCCKHTLCIELVHLMESESVASKANYKEEN